MKTRITPKGPSSRFDDRQGDQGRLSSERIWKYFERRVVGIGLFDLT